MDLQKQENSRVIDFALVSWTLLGSVSIVGLPDVPWSPHIGLQITIDVKLEATIARQVREPNPLPDLQELTKSGIPLGSADWPEDKFNGPGFELSSAAADIENFGSATEDFILDKAEVPQKERKYCKGRCKSLDPKLKPLTTSVRDYTEAKDKAPESFDTLRGRLYLRAHNIYKQAQNIHFTKWLRVCPTRADPPNISQPGSSSNSSSSSGRGKGTRTYSKRPPKPAPRISIQEANSRERKTGGPLGVL